MARRAILFGCGVVKHVDFDASGEEDIFTIGKKGKLVTMKDVIETLRQVCNDDNLEEWRWSGRSFYFQGYLLSRDGRTVRMSWSWGS